MLQAFPAREVGKLQQWKRMAANHCHALHAITVPHPAMAVTGAPIMAAVGIESFQRAIPDGMASCFSTLIA
jgi:hypothetical protein